MIAPSTTSQNILIVGGAGYIGSHTAKYLLAKGYTCVIADNLVHGHKKAVHTLKFEQGDLLDKNFLRAIFQKHPIDAVIHFAAFSCVGESVTSPAKYYANNVTGTLNLLDAMLDKEIKKIVFSSTCSTYGSPQYTPIDEKHPQSPITPYGRTKHIIEQIFNDYEHAYGLEHISLRYFNAAGAALDKSLGESHSPETHLIPLVLQAIKGERPEVCIFGTDYDTPDGTCLRDYIHVEDLAKAHALALEKIGTFNGCLNLGTGVPTSVKEIIHAAEKVTGKPCPVRHSARRLGDPPVLFATYELARKVLGWNPEITAIEDIIKTAWEWESDRKF